MEEIVITDELLTIIAAGASADRRSVIRRLVGLPVRGIRGQAIDREMRRHRLVTVVFQTP